MGSFTENLRYVDTLSLLYVGLAVALAVLVLPALGMGIYWWREERKRTQQIDTGEERPEEEVHRHAA